MRMIPQAAALASSRLPKRRLGARRLWLAVHRWLALVVGLLFVLLGLTGSLIVFGHRLDELLNPELLTTNGRGEYRSLDAILDAARRAVPGAEMASGILFMPRTAAGVFVARLTVPGDRKGETRVVEVGIDPYTAEVLGQRPYGSALMSIIYDLHWRLLLGDAGRTIVGLLGLCLMVSLATGLYLWWPGRGTVASALTIKRGASPKRLNFDLHRTLGLYSAVVLLVIVFSGVYMIFPHYVTRAVEMFSPVTTEYPAQLRSSPRPGARPIPISRAVAIADSVFPKAELKFVVLPEGPQGVYQVTKRKPGEARRSGGASRVFIDQYSGEVLMVQDPDGMTAGDVFLAWQFSLHNGEAFGLAGRWVVFAAGLVPLALYVTGLVIWWNKRGARLRREERATRALEPIGAPAGTADGTLALPGTRGGASPVRRQ